MLKDLNQLKDKSNHFNILNQNLLPVVFFLLRKLVQSRKFLTKEISGSNGAC